MSEFCWSKKNGNFSYISPYKQTGHLLMPENQIGVRPKKKLYQRANDFDDSNSAWVRCFIEIPPFALFSGKNCTKNWKVFNSSAMNHWPRFSANTIRI